MATLPVMMAFLSNRQLRSHRPGGGWLQQEGAGAEALEGDGGEPQAAHRALARPQGGAVCLLFSYRVAL